MKKFIQTILVSGFILAAPLFTLAQNPPPPNNGNGAPGSGNTPVGGGTAPIGSGLILLLSMGMAYGAKKVYELKKSN